MRQALIAAVTVALAAASAMSSGAGAEEALDPIGAEELAAERGGFVLPNGVEVQMGALARTEIGGQVVLETQFVWTDQGLEKQGQSADFVQLAPDAGLGADAFRFTDANGTTAFAHTNALANIVVNEANNRDIRQTITVDIALPNFDSVRGVFETQLLAARLFGDGAALP